MNNILSPTNLNLLTNDVFYIGGFIVLVLFFGFFIVEINKANFIFPADAPEEAKDARGNKDDKEKDQDRAGGGEGRRERRKRGANDRGADRGGNGVREDGE